MAINNPSNSELTLHWEIMYEVVVRSVGGAREQEPTKLPITILSPHNIAAGNTNITAEASFQAPPEAGEYRVFLYVYDKHGKVGNANYLFFVKAKGVTQR